MGPTYTNKTKSSCNNSFQKHLKFPSSLSSRPCVSLMLPNISNQRKAVVSEWLCYKQEVITRSFTKEHPSICGLIATTRD